MIFVEHFFQLVCHYLSYYVTCLKKITQEIVCENETIISMSESWHE